MCGICGFLTRRHVPHDALNQMNQSLYHRGPDDGGLYFSKLGGLNLGLAHRRLSIVDLSEAGHQPMLSKDKSVAIVFNGEVYNFRELRAELAPLGHHFTSDCDTEVIIEAYFEWGISCLERFNGMFALALADFRSNQLYLARDRMGKKPLYYFHDGDELVFASELKAIMLYPGFKKKVRTDVLARYLYRGYIQSPDTIFDKVWKVESAHYAIFQDGKIETHLYWDIADIHFSRFQNGLSYEHALSDFETLLQDSVARRMVADVPIGLFLSGGIDSSLVTAIAQSQSDRPVKTYSIGFNDGSTHNEAEDAARIAKHLGTDHHGLYLKEDDFLELLDALPHHYDEPFGDASAIPTMLVSAFARRDVTVVLSGDGGDELFCGYNPHERARQLQTISHFKWLAQFLSFNKNVAKTLRYLSDLSVADQMVDPDKENQIRNLLVDSQCQISAAFDEGRFADEPDWQVRRMMIDSRTYMIDDVLCKVDRASMRSSLEVRCPLLDTRIVEFAYTIPHEYAYKNRVRKRIMKDLLYRYVPRELVDRPKTGFGISVTKYLDSRMAWLESVSKDESIKEQGIFKPGVLESVGTQPSLMWNYLMFQMWWHEYME